MKPKLIVSTICKLRDHYFPFVKSIGKEPKHSNFIVSDDLFISLNKNSEETKRNIQFCIKKYSGKL